MLRYRELQEMLRDWNDRASAILEQGAKSGQYHYGIGRTILRMKTKQLTRKQESSVRCPTCGAAAGERCALHAGGLRFSPHTDRKLLAAEVVEKSGVERRRIRISA